MQALRRETGGRVQFAGVGGEQMAAQGLDSFFPFEDLSLVGFFEMLARYPRAYRSGLRMIGEVARLRPAVVVFIHVPTFSYHAARKLAPLKIPIIQYVAPQMWIYRHPHKLAVTRSPYVHMLSILPFEPDFFRRYGLACTFVGHPSVENAGTEFPTLTRPQMRARFRTAHQIGEEAPVVCLLPGSRASEIRRLLPIFCDAAELLQRRLPGVRFVLPTVEPVAAQVRRELKARPGLPITLITHSDEKRFALAAADVALAASGTVTADLAIAGLPAIVTYRLHALTWLLSLWLTRPTHLSLVNLILGRRAQPEFRQQACNAKALAGAVEHLLHDPQVRAAQQTAYVEAVQVLGQGDARPPSHRAARIILQHLAMEKSQDMPRTLEKPIQRPSPHAEEVVGLQGTGV